MDCPFKLINSPAPVQQLTHLDMFCRLRSVFVRKDTCSRNFRWCYSREPHSLHWSPRTHSHLRERNKVTFITSQYLSFKPQAEREIRKTTKSSKRVKCLRFWLKTPVGFVFLSKKGCIFLFMPVWSLKVQHWRLWKMFKCLEIRGNYCGELRVLFPPVNLSPQK